MKKIFVFMLFCCMLMTNVNAFANENTITRATFADITMDTYEYITCIFSSPTFASDWEGTGFDDVGCDIEYWDRITQANINKFMRGVGDGMFYPEQTVTREQAAIVIHRLIQVLNQGKHGKNNYSDVKLESKERANIIDCKDISPWAIQGVEFLVSVGFMDLEDGRFEPQKDVTEEEINKLTDKIKAFYVPEDDEKERIDFETFLKRMREKVKDETNE